MTGPHTEDVDDIVEGLAALTSVANKWQELGQGKVEADYIKPYLVVRRSNSDYTLFVPVTEEEAVLVWDDDATTRHIPEAARATGEPSDDAIERLNRAFEGNSAGMFPVEDEGGFGVAFREDGDYLTLVVPAGADEPYITDDL